MTWRDNLLPASFRGVEFQVEIGARASGRRIAPHEFPKRDEPYAEDMGRRIRRHPLTIYFIGPDYQAGRDQLIDALEREGPGLLVHPTLGSFDVVCGGYTVVERRERGGYAEFDVEFMEAGTAPGDRFFDDTQGAVQTGADAAGQEAASAVDRNLDASVKAGPR